MEIRFYHFMKIAIYPGSFDPITNGHLDIIKRAANIFDKVIVSVIKNPSKKPQFSLGEREKMIKDSLKGLNNVEVDSFDGLLVSYAKQKNANVIVRGLRAVSDFDYEFQMALTNRKMVPEIETLFFMTDHKYSYLSSSFVKEIARLGGKVDEMVPDPVAKKLHQA
jgi:pantetheine-phosphate adenylyltransferase